MPEPVKVLSLQQPYCDLILCGLKWSENRSWRTHYRGRIYLHSSRLCATEIKEWSNRGINLRKHLELRIGEILGCAELVDCVRPVELLRFAPKPVRDKQALWFGKTNIGRIVPARLEPVAAFLSGIDAQTWEHVTFDPEGFCWILSKPQVLAQPVATGGKLNVWEFPWDQRFNAFRDL